MTTTLQPRPDWLAWLRSVMVLRPGQRVAHVPGVGVRTSRRAVSSGAVSWWLAGGAPAPVAVYQPKGAASLAASYVNLANPGTYDAAPGVAPTFDAATGWTFDGSTQYLTTGVLPTTAYSMVARFSDASGTADHVVVGAYEFSGNVKTFRMVPRSGFGGANRSYEYISGAGVAGGALTGGVMALTPTNAYLNGTSDGNVSPGTYAWTTARIYMGTSSSGSAPQANRFFAGKIQAVAIYNTTLTADMVAAVSAAMAVL